MNGALWGLVRGIDIPACLSIVIKNAQEIPISGNCSIDLSHRDEGSSSFTGQTNLGNAEVHENRARVIEKSFGSTKARVGHFKILRREKDGIGLISFEHYWASDSSTQGMKDDPITYDIRYDLKTLEPISFGVFEEVEAFSIWIFHWIKVMFHPLPEGEPVFSHNKVAIIH
ncbi:MAG TPA: hypothetical protein VGE35_03180 [Candidatus Paceibacterota bacterium]